MEDAMSTVFMLKTETQNDMTLFDNIEYFVLIYLNKERMF